MTKFLTKRVSPTDPFLPLINMTRNLTRTSADLDDMLESIFHDKGLSLFRGVENKCFVPAIDIFYKENEILCVAEVSGIKKEDLEISIDHKTLIIKGTKNEDESTKDIDKSSRYVERSFGEFERRISIPDGVDEENITSSYENGVLNITIPLKSEIPKTKKIEII